MTEVVVMPMGLEGGKMRWSGACAARANASKEGLVMGFWVLRHASVVHAGAWLASKTG